MYDWSDTRHISIVFDPSLYLFFDQLDKLCSNVASITIHTGKYLSLSFLVKKKKQRRRE